MKQNVLWLLLLIAIAGVSWVRWTGQAQSPVKNNWEYRVVPATGTELTILNDLGAEGWELVTIRTQEQGVGNAQHSKDYYYFKRPR